MKTMLVEKKTARGVRVRAVRRGNREAGPVSETKAADDRQIEEIGRTFSLRYER